MVDYMKESRVDKEGEQERRHRERKLSYVKRRKSATRNRVDEMAEDKESSTIYLVELCCLRHPHVVSRR
jgi:hypothetical protein